MGVRMCGVDFEHVYIEYEGGAITMRFKEYHQTLKLCKKVHDYGEDVVVISSSAWFECEDTLKWGEHCYYSMLCSGALMNVDKPTRYNEFSDECVINNTENQDYD